MKLNILIVCVVGLAVGLITVAMNGSFEVLMLTALSLILVLGSMLVQQTQSKVPLKGFHIAVVSFFASYMFRGYSLAYGWIDPIAQVPNWEPARITLLLGILTFFLVYLSSPVRKSNASTRPARRTALSMKKARLAMIVGMAISYASLLALAGSLGGYDGLRSAMISRRVAFEGMGYITWGIQVGSIFFLDWFLSYLYMGGRLLSIKVGVIALLCIIPLLFLGGRASLAGISLVVALISVKLRPKSAYLIPIGIVFFLVFSFVYPIWSRVEPTTGFSATVRQVITMFSQDGLQSVAGGFAVHLTEYDTLAVITNGVPDRMDYQWGKTFVSLLSAPIPRQMYPDKPPGAAELFGRTFFPSLWSRGSGFRPGIIGELYMNFGQGGVIFGMALMGLFIRYLDAWQSRLSSDPSSLLGMAMTMAHIPQLIRGEFLGTSVSFLTMYIPAYLVLRWCISDKKALVVARCD